MPKLPIITMLFAALNLGAMFVTPWPTCLFNAFVAGFCASAVVSRFQLRSLSRELQRSFRVIDELER